jgi:hypothetical protein
MEIAVAFVCYRCKCLAFSSIDLNNDKQSKPGERFLVPFEFVLSTTPDLIAKFDATNPKTPHRRAYLEYLAIVSDRFCPAIHSCRVSRSSRTSDHDLAERNRVRHWHCRRQRNRLTARHRQPAITCPLTSNASVMKLLVLQQY